MILGRVKNYVSVAQGTEHRSPKAGVGGSNPLRDTMKKDRPRVCLFSCLHGGDEKLRRRFVYGCIFSLTPVSRRCQGRK